MNSYEVANLAIAQFQNAKQNQNALFLLWQSGKRIGNKFKMCIRDSCITHIHFIVHERLAKCCYVRSVYIL